MRKTMNTLYEISRRYRGKRIADAEFSQKLSEDLIKTIGIDKLNAQSVVQNLIQTQYRGRNLGDITTNRRFVEDVIFIFDTSGVQIKEDLDMPSEDSLNYVEPPLTREQVAEMYNVNKDEKTVEQNIEAEVEKVVKKPVPKKKRKVKRS